MTTSPETLSEPSIIMYGTPWCGDCTRSRRWLEQNGVGYRYVDIEDEPEAVAVVERLNDGLRSVPTIVFADGSILVEPSNKALAAKLGITV